MVQSYCCCSLSNYCCYCYSDECYCCDCHHNWNWAIVFPAMDFDYLTAMRATSFRKETTTTILHWFESLVEFFVSRNDLRVCLGHYLWLVHHVAAISPLTDWIPCRLHDWRIWHQTINAWRWTVWIARLTIRLDLDQLKIYYRFVSKQKRQLVKWSNETEQMKLPRSRLRVSMIFQYFQSNFWLTTGNLGVKCHHADDVVPFLAALPYLIMMSVIPALRQLQTNEIWREKRHENK